LIGCLYIFFITVLRVVGLRILIFFIRGHEG